MVTTADITIASERATLMDPHVSIGVTSGREGVRLARVLPLPVARKSWKSFHSFACHTVQSSSVQLSNGRRQVCEWSGIASGTSRLSQ